jgi:hypothetical protein
MRKASFATAPPGRLSPIERMPSPLLTSLTISRFVIGSHPRAITLFVCAMVVMRSRNSVSVAPQLSGTAGFAD